MVLFGWVDNVEICKEAFEGWLCILVKVLIYEGHIKWIVYPKVEYLTLWHKLLG